VNPTLQVAFPNTDAGLHCAQHRDVIVRTRMGCAGDGDLSVGEVERIRAARFDQRQRLKRFRSGAQIGDKIRVAGAGDQLPLCVNDGYRARMDGFDQRPAR
jgi:hypothetical protein